MKQLAKIRTDVVGSLLRPLLVKQAYAQHDAGKIGAEELHRIEDDAIRQAVRFKRRSDWRSSPTANFAG